MNATNHTDKRRWNHTRNGSDEEQPTEKRVSWLRTSVNQGKFCARCGGWSGHLGLEPTPELYTQHLVEVFREVRRVLADDGTLWLNLGDCYATGAGKVGNHPGGGAQADRLAGRGMNTKDPKWAKPLGPISQPNRMPIAGLKPKDLLGMPWRIAFALQADGWYLRSDIIWHKPNTMPESVKDRPTRAHEYLFLFAKSERYFYDHEAIQEPAKLDTLPRYLRGRSGDHKWADGGPGNQSLAKSLDAMALAMRRSGNNARKYDEPKIEPTRKDLHSARHERHRSRTAGGQDLRAEPTYYRNRRTVWTIPTKPFKGAHFATFPPELVEPCISAGSLRVGDYEPQDLIRSPEGEGEREADPSMVTGRAGFNRPRRRIERVRPMSRAEQAAYAEALRGCAHKTEMMSECGGESTFAHYLRTDRNGARAIPEPLLKAWIERGWLTRIEIPPRIAADHRSVVLDPFFGAGTTGMVAAQLGRRFIGIELNPNYSDLARESAETKTEGIARPRRERRQQLN